MQTGDTFTIAGVYSQVRNPERQWWQFWKPRMVASSELARFEVRSAS